MGGAPAHTAGHEALSQCQLTGIDAGSAGRAAHAAAGRGASAHALTVRHPDPVLIHPAMATRLFKAFFKALVAIPQQTLLLLLRGYRLLLSPWLGSACRFEPTCSAYAMQAIQRHGALQGSGLMAWRVLRCHPWCAGGCDPVPEQPPLRRVTAPLFTRLLKNHAAPPASSLDSTPPTLAAHHSRKNPA